MLAWLSANWMSLGVAIISGAEILALFVPGAQGTVKTLIQAATGLGVKDPGIGGL